MHNGIRFFGGANLGLIAALALFVPAAGARGSAVPLLFSVPVVSAAQGSSGSFDVIVTGEANGVHLAGESIELGVSDSGVEFTATDMNTAKPYVFNPSFDADFSSPLDVSGIAYPKTDFITSDLSDSPFQLINLGDTFGVVHVSYTVDAGATLGPRHLTIEDLGGATSTSDELGNAIAFTVNNGLFNVTAVPEPGSVGVLVLGGISVLARRRGR